MDQKVRTMPIIWKIKPLLFAEAGNYEVSPDPIVSAIPFVWDRSDSGEGALNHSFRAHIFADLAPRIAEALRSGKIVRFRLGDQPKEIAVERFDIAEPAEGETLVLLSFTGRFLGAEAATSETATILGGS